MKQKLNKNGRAHRKQNTDETVQTKMKNKLIECAAISFCSLTWCCETLFYYAHRFYTSEIQTGLVSSCLGPQLVKFEWLKGHGGRTTISDDS